MKAGSRLCPLGTLAFTGNFLEAAGGIEPPYGALQAPA